MARKKNRPAVEPVEIDFHGWRPDEVYRELTRLVDRHEGAKGLPLRIVHGRGAGILASEVERFARNDPRVASAEKDFFNPGVTTLLLNGRTGSRAAPLPETGRWERIPEPPIRKGKR